MRMPRLWGTIIKPANLLLITVLCACVSPGDSYGATYTGNGITFHYPDTYRLEEKAEKSLKRVTITDGTSSIAVNIIGTELSADLENRLIESYRKKFAAMKLEDIRFSPKRKTGTSGKMPFPGLGVPVSRVDTSFACKGVRFLTTLYFCSAEGGAYVIELTCAEKSCPDFSFFKKSLARANGARKAMQRFIGRGISFTYPEDFEVSVVKKRPIYRLVIKKKGSSLGVIELSRPLDAPSEDLMIKDYREKLEKAGFTHVTVSGKKPMGRNTTAAFPFKKIDTAVTAVTFSFRRKGVGYETLLYMFPYGKKGYTIDITRMSGIKDVFGFVYDTLEIE